MLYIMPPWRRDAHIRQPSTRREVQAGFSQSATGSSGLLASLGRYANGPATRVLSSDLSTLLTKAFLKEVFWGRREGIGIPNAPRTLGFMPAAGIDVYLDPPVAKGI